MQIPFKLYNVFSSSMVLQRQEPIVFSGTGEPGRSFNIAFAGCQATGTVGMDGRWHATFKPLPPGGPYTLEAGYDGQAATVRLEDILLGDVWYCSGQSNMQMPLWSPDPYWRAENAEEEAANAIYPQMRLCNCLVRPGRKYSPEQVQEDEMDCVHWEACTPDTAKTFSALGYFFGRQLHQDLNIPIGIIATALGGTRIEAWISREKLQSCGYADPAMPENSRPQLQDKLWKTTYWGSSPQSVMFREWVKSFDALGQPPQDWLKLDFDDSQWKNEVGTELMAPNPSRTLFRLTFTLPRDFHGENCKIHVGVLDDCDHCHLNGTFIGETTPEVFGFWAQDRRYPVPHNCLRPGKNVLAVALDAQANYGTFNAGNFGIESNGKFLPLQFTAKSKTVFIVPGTFPQRPPLPSTDCVTTCEKSSANYQSILYNTLAHPWFKYNIKGIIWYQGCANSGNYAYYKLHKLLIEECREKWNKPALPFLLVQLAAWLRFNAACQELSEGDDNPCAPSHDFAIIREIQQAIADNVPNTAMITAFDRGQANDIHPRDKQTLGYRLAITAENMLGYSSKPCDGPIFKSFQNCGTYAIINFKNAKGLHTTDGLPPKGFAAAGPAGIFAQAKAEIRGEQVIVTLPDACSISNVHYAFTNFCTVNLVNGEGLPALPFRTDRIDYSTWD